jgi:hypothetical protein
MSNKYQTKKEKTVRWENEPNSKPTRGPYKNQIWALNKVPQSKLGKKEIYKEPVETYRKSIREHIPTQPNNNTTQPNNNPTRRGLYRTSNRKSIVRLPEPQNYSNDKIKNSNGKINIPHHEYIFRKVNPSAIEQNLEKVFKPAQRYKVPLPKPEELTIPQPPVFHSLPVPNELTRQTSAYIPLPKKPKEYKHVTYIPMPYIPITYKPIPIPIPIRIPYQPQKYHPVRQYIPAPSRQQPRAVSAPLPRAPPQMPQNPLYAPTSRYTYFGPPKPKQ